MEYLPCGLLRHERLGLNIAYLHARPLDGKAESPDYQVVVDKSTWVRAERGGFLKFHVKPGDIIEKDQPLATNTTLLGRERSMLYSPFDAVVIGMTTLPAISPGEPICNLGMLPEGTKPSQIRRYRREEDGLEGQVVEELSTNLIVVEPTEESSLHHHKHNVDSYSELGETTSAE